MAKTVWVSSDYHSIFISDPESIDNGDSNDSQETSNYTCTTNTIQIFTENYGNIKVTLQNEIPKGEYRLLGTVAIPAPSGMIELSSVGGTSAKVNVPGQSMHCKIFGNLKPAPSEIILFTESEIGEVAFQDEFCLPKKKYEWSEDSLNLVQEGYDYFLDAWDGTVVKTVVTWWPCEGWVIAGG